MSGFDWRSVVKGVAPALGAALGGPFGGAATKFLAEKFLGNPDANESDLADAIMSASPEKLIEIRKLDAEFKIRMRELDVDVFKVEIDDRKDARSLARVNMTPQISLSVVYSLGYFALLYLFMTGQTEVATSLKSEFNIVLGVMTAAQASIMQFWFGSSAGSKSKDSR